MLVRSQRALIWWAIAFMLIFGSAWFWLIGTMPLPPATQSAEQVAAFYAANSMKIRWGALICSWTGAFFVPFFTVISVQLARVEKGFPIWSLLQFGGGMMMTIFLVVPPLLWGVAAFEPTRPPEVTMLMHEFANLMLVTTDQYFIFEMIPISVVALAYPTDPDSPFPRWLAYFNIWAALMFECGVAGFVPKTGPFAWNGLFVFWLPLVIISLWTIVMIILLFKALSRQEASGTA